MTQIAPSGPVAASGKSGESSDPVLKARLAAERMPEVLPPAASELAELRRKMDQGCDPLIQKAGSQPYRLLRSLKQEPNPKAKASVIVSWLAFDRDGHQVVLHKVTTFTTFPPGCSSVEFVLVGAAAEDEKLPPAEFDRVLRDFLGGF